MYKDKFTFKKENHSAENDSTRLEENKLIALWALSESTLGGILHAIRFPFRGIIISSAAVILMSSMVLFGNKRGRIFKACVTVIGAKAAISPYTPVTAHFSVLIQGLLGELFFLSRKFNFFLIVIFSVTVQLINGFQKIIVLTVIFGAALWKTINDFLNYVVGEWFFIKFSGETDYSFFIISFYIGIHLIAGFLFGIIAYRIPMEVKVQLSNYDVINFNYSEEKQISKPKEKSIVKLKFSSILILIMFISIITASYFYPEENRFDVTAVLLMLVRAICVIFIWFYFISPFISNLIRRKNSGNTSRYSKEISFIVTQIPHLRTISYHIWKSTSDYKGLKRIYQFIIKILAYFLSDKNNLVQY